jgi:hypothetical protein
VVWGARPAQYAGSVGLHKGNNHATTKDAEWSNNQAF